MPASRRRSPRARHDSVLELSDETGAPLPGTPRLVDLSDHGLAFATTQELAVGARLGGTLRTLSRGARLFSGRVVRRERRRNALVYAVEFDGHAPVPPLDARLGGTD